MPTIVDGVEQPGEGQSCEGCPIATGRRAFLRDAALAAVAAIGAIAVVRPGAAFADAVREIAPTAASLLERTYTIPAADGVSIDVDNSLILARWENRLYAFSLKCPHKGARLEWRASEQRVFCPKHKARFLANGSHVSGRGSRDLDRYALRRTSGGVAVDLARTLRQDREPDAWDRAALAV